MEKRKFQRINFISKASLQFGGETWQTQVVDLCLKGAMVERPESWNAHQGGQGMLYVHLPDGETRIAMHAHVAHQQDDYLGIGCDFIDIDSITHLRRLVELNSGDAELLERDLEALFED